jgi:outer membrane protein assembly factor BamB
VLVAIQWLLWTVAPAVLPDQAIYAAYGALGAGPLILLWWLFLSKAPWLERLGILALIAVAATLTRLYLIHPSIANGMRGLMFIIYAIPALSLVLVLGAVVGNRLTPGWRRAALAAAILLGSGGMAVLRTEGITGEGRSQFAWRWTASPEEQLLARVAAEAPAPAPAAAPESPADAAGAPKASPAAAATVPPRAAPEPPAPEWPGFRGPAGDAVVAGLRIYTDWKAQPPVELWRRPVGPGCSSVAAGGGLIYTQEQRGEHEVVTCYRADTGAPVWTHQDNARFWESNAGAGPRATPALHQGRVYSLGATGILNALDARTGAVLWTRNAAADTEAKLPGWGFAGSPRVLGDAVVVALSGRLAAYDLANGNLRWLGPQGGTSYSSPHLFRSGGAVQVVLLDGAGVTSVAPADGSVLWQYAWRGSSMLQPASTADGAMLVNSGDAAGGLGTRRLAVAQAAAGWNAQEVWTSRGLKPYFNDLVVHGQYAFGFDGNILSCIDLNDGARKWKGGRYGHGQMLLIRDQDVLLVLSEEGEIALVSATPGQFSELARVPAIEGKTWNHPAVAGDLLVVRNGEEMAAFRLPARSH